MEVAPDPRDNYECVACGLEYQGAESDAEDWDVFCCLECEEGFGTETTA